MALTDKHSFLEEGNIGIKKCIVNASSIAGEIVDYYPPKIETSCQERVQRELDS